MKSVNHSTNILAIISYTERHVSNIKHSPQIPESNSPNKIPIPGRLKTVCSRIVWRRSSKAQKSLSESIPKSRSEAIEQHGHDLIRRNAGLIRVTFREQGRDLRR